MVGVEKLPHIRLWPDRGGRQGKTVESPVPQLEGLLFPSVAGVAVLPVDVNIDSVNVRLKSSGGGLQVPGVRGLVDPGSQLLPAVSHRRASRGRVDEIASAGGSAVGVGEGTAAAEGDATVNLRGISSSVRGIVDRIIAA
ncbi:hypothetical protein [Kitasatospora sp. NPDC056184]|uniref:hypothetical protein n=1 Tax=Kitasatospora sp. NPDC056184 TaxID=3345738 RepID=UPI0035DF00AA